MPPREERVSVGGRELSITNLDKVIFPATGFTKGQLIDYYVNVAPVLLPHIDDRPLTVKRYPDGVDKKFFYEKHVPRRAPEWMRRVAVPASKAGEPIEYAVVGDLAALVWVANLAAIEVHVPLWHIGRRRSLPAAPDFMVFDLDPGEGTTIVECCAVAGHIHEILTEKGMVCRVKTSGSKGLQVYAELPGRPTWDRSRAEALGIATQLEKEFPALVTSNMRKSLRQGRILIDWSQNHPAKTTVAVYSVRAMTRPTVSTPVTWEEVRRCERRADPTVLEFTTTDVLARVKKKGDLFAFGAGGERPAAARGGGGAGTGPEAALRVYRSKRDPSKTPEPMGDAPSPASSSGSRSKTPKATKKATKKTTTKATTKASPQAHANDAPVFVIQEHHARALHWDFRLEHNGVLVSWALPKGIPLDPKTNHLAVHTEDHPMEYGSFEGDIPAGEYGGGVVRIWDHGTFELEKWRDDEVMVVLHGSRASGRYVLFPTKGKNWMIHRMDPAPTDFEALPASVRPMLAIPGSLPRNDKDWAFEIKWDGVRAIAFVDGGRVRLDSRNGKDLTTSFPEFRELGAFIGARPAVLDGEIVVMSESGRPDFGRLAHRLHLTNDSAIKRLAHDDKATYIIFDVVHLDGRPLFSLPYDARRSILEELGLSGHSFTTTESFREVQGADILRATSDNGLEGVIAKRRSSTYAQGKRSDEWIKVKNIRTQEVVIGGWTEGGGNRTGSLGALLLGIPGDKGLRFVGKVGTGFGDRDRQELLQVLGPAESARNPFTPASDVKEPGTPHFVQPLHVGEVQFTEWTTAGRLRHPTWRGLRPDKNPADVTVEE